MVGAGFETINQWGTQAERDWLYNNCPEGYPKSQVVNGYGINAQIYNFTSGASTSYREIIKRTMLVTRQPGEDFAYCHYNGGTQVGMPDAEVGTEILKSDWFGIEYRVLKSNPAGDANGGVEVWIYNKNGEIIAHELDDGIVTFKDGATQFNHKWNKFEWGGNRYDDGYCGAAGPGCDFGDTSHFYLDEIIVHGSRIGPAYFTLLNPQPGCDINGDGRIDLTDGVLSLQVASGLEPAGITLEGDADGDGRIGISEAIMILRKLGGDTPK